MKRITYTSTVLGPMQLVIGAILALLLTSFVLACGGSAWVAVPAGVVVMAAALHLAVVRLAVDPESVRIASGWWGIGRRTIPGRVIVAAAPVELTTTQTYWRPPSDRIEPVEEQTADGSTEAKGMKRGPVTRLTVRSGATLRLTLTSGETLWISTAHPEDATAIISGRSSS
jgi:hypothetical protein